MSLEATRAHRRVAGGVAAVIVVTVLVVFPYAEVPAPVIASFLPMFAAAVFVTEGLTAYLLWVQFLVARHIFLATLAGAYVFTAILVAMQLAMFPGEFSSGGLLGAGPQSAVWLWVIWHLGVPTLVLLALVLGWKHPGPLPPARAMRTGLALAVAVPLSLAAAAGFLATRGVSWLPTLLEAPSYVRLLDNPTGMRIGLLAAGVLACLVVGTRLRTLLELWLAVALLAAVADIVLTLEADARYSVGWYAGRMLAMFASSAVLGALIWEINRLYQQLHAVNIRLSEHAARDGLTGLYNRRYFDEHFAAELARARLSDHPLSILMIDIDHFKRFNDTLGHLRGDDTLVTVAGTLRTSLRRSGDFIARYGGEEFVVVLPDCDAPAAEQLAQGMRAEVARRAIATPFSPGHVTISVGVAYASGPEPASASELLARADSALYRAKNAGHNCVAV